jgi:hypothetical protein
VKFPPPDATYSEIQAWGAALRDERLAKIAPFLDRAIENAINRPRKPRGACSSCWELGHRRGDKACPNYDSPVRWQAHGKVWKP